MFTGAMVRAILDGRKTQTRRVIKPWTMRLIDDVPAMLLECPYGVPGDRLWVRETWCHIGSHSGPETCGKSVQDVRYRADRTEGYVWSPSIFMPRWASRITLEVTGVRVQRVQEISEEDAMAEGAFLNVCDWWEFGNGFRGEKTPIGAYRSLWDTINFKRGFGWSVNPWVWVVEFRRVE